MIKTNTGLVAWCNHCLNNGYGYVYGTYFAAPITEAMIQYKAKQYPDLYTDAYITRSRKWLGKVAGDCIGLIKAYYWQDDNGKVIYRYGDRPDTSANGMRSLCTVKGTMDTLPELQGVLLFRDGHVGVYVGSGYAIESRGVDYGVVKTAVSGRGWTSWGNCPQIEYGESDDMLQRGDKGTAVRQWQTALLKAGYALPNYGADSDFGGETETATKAFQSKVGLSADGIVSTNTFGFMCFTLSSLTGDKAELDQAKITIAQQASEMSQVKTQLATAQPYVDRYNSLVSAIQVIKSV